MNATGMTSRRSTNRLKFLLVLCLVFASCAGIWGVWAYGGDDHLTLRGEIVMDMGSGVVIHDLQTHALRRVTFESIDRPQLSEVNAGPNRGYIVSGVEFDRALPGWWKGRAYVLDARGRLVAQWAGMSAVYLPESDKIAYLVRGAGRAWTVMISDADHPGARSAECGQRGFPVGPEEFDPWRDSRFLRHGLVPCGEGGVCFLSPRGTIDICDVGTLEVRSGPAGVECLPQVWLSHRSHLLCETRDAQLHAYDPQTGELRDFNYVIRGRPVYVEDDQVLVWTEIGPGRFLVPETLTWSYLSLRTQTTQTVRFQPRSPSFWRPS